MLYEVFTLRQCVTMIKGLNVLITMYLLKNLRRNVFEKVWLHAAHTLPIVITRPSYEAVCCLKAMQPQILSIVRTDRYYEVVYLFQRPYSLSHCLKWEQPLQ